MIHGAVGGGGQNTPDQPLEPQNDDTHDDDQGGKETIPDAAEPAPSRDG